MRPLLHAARGRTLGPGDDAPGAEPAVLLSDRTWRAPGADPSVVGRPVGVNGHAVTVVGVLPGGFYGLSLDAPPDVWLPMGAAAVALPQFSEDDLLRRRRFSWVDIAVRLDPAAVLREP